MSAIEIQDSKIPDWQPADSLPAHAAEPHGMKSWLTHRGLLTARLQEHFGTSYSLRVVALRRGIPDASALAALRCSPQEMLIREIELVLDGRVMVFAQTLVPDAMVRSQPWVATLGGNALGERLATLESIERGAFECANLQPGQELWERSLRDAVTFPHNLWARRSWIAIAEVRMLVIEVFLPEFAQCIR